MPKRVAPRLHRILETPEARIDRRDHFPAATVIGIALEMGFDLRNQAVDGLGAASSGKPERQRLIRQRRRAERKIGSRAAERHHDQRRKSNRAPARTRRSCSQSCPAR